MARKLVKFTQGYSRYNRGETAGFEQSMAESLTEGKNKVGVIVGDADEPGAHKSVVIGKMDTTAASQIIGKARLELEGRAQSLADQEAALDKRAQELADREEALNASEAAIATGEPEVEPAAIEQGKPTDEPKGNGEPPKQGAKKPGA